MNNIGASISLNISPAGKNSKDLLPSRLMERKEGLLRNKDSFKKSIECSTEYIENTDAQIQELKPQIAREKSLIRRHKLLSFGILGPAIAATIVSAAAGCSVMAPLIAVGCGVAISLASLVKCSNYSFQKINLESNADDAANRKNAHTELIAGWNKKIENADREIAEISKQIESLQSDPSQILGGNVKGNPDGTQSDAVSTDDDMLVVDGVRLKKKNSFDFLSHLLHGRHEQA